MKLVLVNSSVSSTSTAVNTEALTTATVEDLIQQVQYRGNKVFNLDPQSLLSVAERAALSAELSPAITRIRVELVKQQNRIVDAFSAKNRVFKEKFPADSLDYVTAGYSDLESSLEEIFIETKDLEDLIAKGVPAVIVKSRLKQIRANLRFVVSVLKVSLREIEWREIESSAIQRRNWQMPMEERDDTTQAKQRKMTAAEGAATWK